MADKISVFKTSDGQRLGSDAYEAVLKNWPVPYDELSVETRFGLTHILACGPTDGPPLILLHGQEASATMWIDNIQELSQAFRVYAVDTMGDIGKSRPVCLPENRMDYAAWLLEVINQLHIEKTNLAGISYGGFLALNFALAYPDRVKRIALLAPGIPNFGRPTFRWAFYGLPMLVFPNHFTVKRFINGASQKGFSASNWVHIQMVVAVPHLRNPNFMRPVFSDEELRQVKLPSLLMIGDKEIMYDPAQAEKRARKLIPNLKVEIIANAGHFLNSDQAEIVNEVLIKFLSDLATGFSQD